MGGASGLCSETIMRESRQLGRYLMTDYSLPPSMTVVSASAAIGARIIER